jgi:hypothetical protein
MLFFIIRSAKFRQLWNLFVIRIKKFDFAVKTKNFLNLMQEYGQAPRAPVLAITRQDLMSLAGTMRWAPEKQRCLLGM